MNNSDMMRVLEPAALPVEGHRLSDAGMFHHGGIDLSQGVRTKAPQDEADGVVTAITQNATEVFVAPIDLRLASTLATVAPALSAPPSRRSSE